MILDIILHLNQNKKSNVVLWVEKNNDDQTILLTLTMNDRHSGAIPRDTTVSKKQFSVSSLHRIHKQQQREDQISATDNGTTNLRSTSSSSLSPQWSVLWMH